MRMLQPKCLSIIICMSGLLVVTSCKPDDKTLESQILGTWDVFASEMNNKPNSFMKDGWFEFTKENIVKSNLFENQENTKYIIDGGKLNIDLPEGFNMNIERLDSDTLILEGKLKYYYMEYFLAKRK